jgi:hypothetical protein
MVMGTLDGPLFEEIVNGVGAQWGGGAMTHTSGSRHLKVVMKMEVGLLAVFKRADREVGRRCGIAEWEKEKPSWA